MSYKLRQKRHELKMSQMELAEWLKCPQSAISRLESGEFKLTLKQFYILKNMCDLRGIQCEISDFI